jgi:hypothetical protein
MTQTIPIPDVIPAPAWVFVLLEQCTFLLHLIVINAFFGGSLLLLFSLFFGTERTDELSVLRPVSAKMPMLVALGINFGVAPLLFSQVLYGHLFYTGSILMAVYWILIIPLLILGYYAAHIYAEKFETSFRISRIALLVSVVIVVYIAFMQVANNSLMERPETWKSYFEHRGGISLNLSVPVFVPRYLHFIFASLAVGGLFSALVYSFGRKTGDESTNSRIKHSLKIFGISTIAQMLVGFWYLMAIPKDFMFDFMGRDLVSTVALMTGIVCGLCSILTGLSGRLRWTFALLGFTLVSMITVRYRLRMMYLRDDFTLSDLHVVPQYSVLLLFLGVLLIGLIAVWYMIGTSFVSQSRESTPGRYKI